MAVLEIKGCIVSNDDKWLYDWVGWDSTCPADVERTIAGMAEGETLEVFINSGGGSVSAGQEIYTRLKSRENVQIEIQSIAGSAASIIAMAGKSKISPVGIIMVHNVSIHGASGDYHDMQKNAEILKELNAALAAAYTEKTGMSQEEALKLMDRETWLTAQKCLELGFVDEIMEGNKRFTNALWGMELTEEMKHKIISEKAEAEKKDKMKQEILGNLDLYGV